MPRATKEELEWAYALTREKFLVRVNKLSPIRAADWNRYLDVIFELILKDEAPIYEPKMNAYLEETVAKYLHPSDDYISLTEIARKFDAENPSYLIQSWMRSRNTVIGTTDLMPTFMIVFRDDTFELDSFHGGLKTTIYRKINEIATRVAKEDIVAIYFMMTYTTLPMNEQYLQMTSKERLALGTEDVLTFMEITIELSERECYFEQAKIQGNYSVQRPQAS